MIIAITGHRDLHDSSIPIVERKIAHEAPTATEIRFGGAIGVDTVALESCCYLRQEKWPELIVIVPYRVADQPKAARATIETCADEVVELDLPRGRQASLRRNDELLDGADRLIAFTDGRTTGGTRYTIQKARELGIEVEIVEVRTDRRKRRRSRRKRS